MVSQSVVQQKTVQPTVDVPVLGDVKQLVTVPAAVSQSKLVAPTRADDRRA